MSIVNLDQALAGMQPPKFFSKSISPSLVIGRYHSAWYLAGIPGAGVADTSTATGVARSNTSALVTGSIPFTDPGSGNSYLARFTGSCGQGTIYLMDRLWDCGANSGGSALSPTSTSAQTINSVAWPARDATGTINGVGVQIALEVSTALGAGTPTSASTITYTNTAGTGSKTGALNATMAATAAIGAFHLFGLAGGDLGVKSIQSITMNASQTSGQWVLVAFRMLAAVDMATAYTANAVDLLTSGFPQLYNGTVPFLVYMPALTTASLAFGTMVATQG